MITFLILPPSRPLRASTSRLAPILPRRPADYHLRPYPPPPYSTPLPYLYPYPPSTLPLPPDSSGCQLYPHLSLPITLAPAPALPTPILPLPPRQPWGPALAPPIPTYHTSPGSSTSTTHPYPTTALWQSFPTYFIRLISPIRPIGPITPTPLYPYSPQPPRI